MLLTCQETRLACAWSEAGCPTNVAVALAGRLAHSETNPGYRRVPVESHLVASRHDAPIRFTLMTGLREGELLRLRWSDVDLKGRVVNLRGSKTANSRRRIELSLAAVRLLSVHRQAQRKRRVSLGPAWHENDLVFPSLLGTPWLRRPFYRDYRTRPPARKVK